MGGQEGDGKKNVTRRKFLVAGGAAAALLNAPRALAAGSGTRQSTVVPPAGDQVASAARSGVDVAHGAPGLTHKTARLHQFQSTGSSPMGRMFPTLPAYNPTDEALVAVAEPMPGRPNENPDNTAIPAGFTVLGQFIDHDITFDAVSDLLGTNDPGTLESGRTAKFDLDSVYGGGPGASPELYDPSDPKKLLLVSPNGPEDVPRAGNGTATIADQRNDMHKLILQLHIAFIKFHNNAVDLERGGGTPEDQVFSEAQRLLRWHYQWLVVHEYLPRVAGQDVVDGILTTTNGVPVVTTEFFHPEVGNAYIPVEFSVAAFRFAHSMVRHAYRLNSLQGFPIFGGATGLDGGSHLTNLHKIIWTFFFVIPGSPATPEPSKRIDHRISQPLAQLPFSVTQTNTLIRNLAERNMRRGKAFGLPSGQAVAAAMGANVQTNGQLGISHAGLGDEAPLWFYIVKEADIQERGRRLGQVGAAIVAEVLLGLMGADPDSYLVADPGFVPAPPIAPSAGTFTVGDFLRFAGVA